VHSDFPEALYNNVMIRIYEGKFSLKMPFNTVGYGPGTVRTAKYSLAIEVPGRFQLVTSRQM
jgi:hypothetical protein